jgi:hypothetical protein
MKFNEFTKKLKVKNHLTGLLEVEDHKLNFAKMFFLNKLTKFNKSSGSSQTGRSTHNTLLSLYNYIHKNESSLIVVFNTEDKQRLIRDLESFTGQLKLQDQIIYSYNYSHEYIRILTLNAWKDQKNILRKKHNHVFIDNEIIDQYHEFLRGKSYDRGNDFFVGLCIDFSGELQQIQDKKSLKSMDCLTLLNDKTVITSDQVEFKEGDLFMITTYNNKASQVGTLIKINYDTSISWASTIDILFDNNIIQMPIQNIEYFTKL